jgi:hypothetical protein
MPKLRNSDIDLLNSPVARVEQRFAEQIDAIAQQLQPQTMRPVTQWLHDRGMRLKDITGK